MSLIQKQFEEALKVYVNTGDYSDGKWTAEQIYDFYIAKNLDNTYHHQYMNMAYAVYKAGREPMKPFSEPQQLLKEVG